MHHVKRNDKFKFHVNHIHKTQQRGKCSQKKRIYTLHTYNSIV